MRDILFLAHRIPFPADRGDKIRSHHMLRWLAERAPVHVATFCETPEDMLHDAELATLAQSSCIVHRATGEWQAGAEALLTGQPVSLRAFRDRRIADFVRITLATGTVRTIFVFSGQMAQYVPPGFDGQLLVDFVDCDSAKFGDYALRDSGAMAHIWRREDRLLRRFEEQVAARADASLLVSEAEAQLFRDRCPLARRVVALPNGVDSSAFDPVRTLRVPELAMPGPHVMFTGQMDYLPNIDGVQHFCATAWPIIRAEIPDARFWIVGRNPHPALQALDGRDGCTVTGTVPEIAGWLAGADCVVAPLRIARGVQNKVLEAMAMARPVIASPEAATGIAAEPGRHFEVADHGEPMARSVLAVLAARKQSRRMGIEARRHVQDTMSWKRALAPLDRLIGGLGRMPVLGAQRVA